MSGKAGGVPSEGKDPWAHLDDEPAIAWPTPPGKAEPTPKKSAQQTPPVDRENDKPSVKRLDAQSPAGEVQPPQTKPLGVQPAGTTKSTTEQTSTPQTLALSSGPSRPKNSSLLATTSSQIPQKRRWRTAGIIAAVIVILLALLLVFIKLDMLNIRRLGWGDVGERPLEAGNAVNILLVGSDTRSDDNAQYGKGVAGERADVNILLHISGDRKAATLVGIPRDSVVSIPPCADSNNPDELLPATTGHFNSAYSRGGISCTVKTFESLTNIRIDHFVIVDFSGFKRMVDALGTVNICLPKAIKDKDSGLNLPAGRQEVGGEDALAYVRLRYGIDDNSDLSRMKRQQAFLSAMAQKAISTGTLTNPAKTRNFIKAATQSTIVDEDLTDGTIASLANSLRTIGLENITFATLPTRPARSNPNWVEWTQSSYSLWEQLRTDTYTPVDSHPAQAPSDRPTSAKAQVADSSAAATPSWSSTNGTPVVSVPADAVTVAVVNGTRRSGLATQVATQLSQQGFRATVAGTASQQYPTTVVRHSPDYTRSAATVLAAVPGSAHQSVAGMGPTVQLVLGQNFTRVQQVMIAPDTSRVKVRKAADDICS